MMNWSTMQLVLDKTSEIRPGLIDITGGAPELNPHLRRFVKTLRENHYSIQVRTNLAILLEPRIEHLIDFYRDNGVKLVASLPCYLRKEVDSVRGDGTFTKSIEVLKRLNDVGYGLDPRLELDLVFNPEGAFLPPQQSVLEREYHAELQEKFGIVFNNLITITNMPVGRFSELLHQQNRYEKYSHLLRESFNLKTLDRLMCRHQVDVGWDGAIYDCDFNLGLKLPIGYGVPSHIDAFDFAALSRRRIVTGDHCFGCTAGNGSSCGGALVD
jgi:radical SAM/Cys-rich protein